jgi:hypothetical protein
VDCRRNFRAIGATVTLRRPQKISEARKKR